jgi:stage II sporulation protein M
LAGICIGTIAAFLLRNHYSDQLKSIFIANEAPGIWDLIAQQLLFITLLFIVGLTPVGTPFLALFPLYKGFSVSLLISLSVVLFKAKGLLLGILTFAPQNMFYATLDFFLCYSSAKLSISTAEMLRGNKRGHGSQNIFLSHVLCTVIISTLHFPGILWEYNIVPLILELY